MGSFSKKNISENSGDGIFAAWALLYQEDSIPDIRKRLSKMGLNKYFYTDKGICPNAEIIQKADNAAHNKSKR